MTVPIRRCAGCGLRAPKAELVRFAARGSELVHDPRGPGRGVYTCRRLSCFERALARRGFSGGLRRRLEVDPSLARLYTDGS